MAFRAQKDSYLLRPPVAVIGMAGEPDIAVPDGTGQPLRIGEYADLMVSQLRGRRTDQSMQGRLFSLSLPATTTGVAAGNIVGAAAAASTNFALWNPSDSTVLLCLLRVIVAPISGTPPGGPLFHSYSQQSPSISSVLTNGTLTDGVCGESGATSQAQGVAVAAGTTLTGGGALSTFRAMPFGFSASAFADAAGQKFVDELDGELIIPPGCLYVPTWAAAGSSLLCAYGVLWEELDLVP